MNLSKSRYTTGKRCIKDLWLSCYKPEEKEETNNDNILETGKKVGDLASVASPNGEYQVKILEIS